MGGGEGMVRYVHEVHFIQQLAVHKYINHEKVVNLLDTASLYCMTQKYREVRVHI